VVLNSYAKRRPAVRVADADAASLLMVRAQSQPEAEGLTRPAGGVNLISVPGSQD
jgi:hypothetical protein